MIKPNARDVPNFEGLYTVDTNGNVYSIRKGVFLKPQNNGKGYMLYALCKNGKRTMVQSHRLVAKTFIPNPNNLPQVNHKDEDKTNNNVANLEWCTAEYNSNYGSRCDRLKKSHSLSGAKATMKVVIQINKNGDVINEFESITDASKNTNIKIQNISACCKGKRKTAGKYIWKLKEI